MDSLTPQDLQEWLEPEVGANPTPTRPAPQLLDVREPWEFAQVHIPGSQLLPLSELLCGAAALNTLADPLNPEQPVVCICHHGVRSSHAAIFLESQGFSQVHNLQGGIDAWAEQTGAKRY